MANSSFDYFRKHSKVAVVALGMLCILAFVVADPLMQWLNASQGGGGGGQRDLGEVAVSWDGGELTEGELSSLVAKRNILAAFLRQVEQVGAYEAVAAGAPANLPPRVQPLRLATEYEQGVESDVLRTQVLADAARDAGMMISDDTIVEYLLALGRDRVSRATMREMIGGINLGRSRATPEFMFDLLRDALLSQSYLASHTYAQATVTPEQRWSDWLKVNDRVVVETAALDVDDFVSEVKDPTDAELKEFFEEYRDVVPTPVIVNNRQLPSPTPGFRRPAKAKLQWARTDYAQALEAARDEVTDEEIAAYYEENKAMFVKSATDMFMPATGLEGAEEDPTEEEDATEDDATETETADDEAAAEDASEEEADTEEMTADVLADEESTTDEPTADGDDAGDTDPPAEGDEESTEAAPEQSSSVNARSPFRLASFLQEEEASDETNEEASEDAEASEGEAPASGDDAAEPAESGSSPLDDFMENGEAAAADDGQDDAASADEPTTNDPEPEVEYQPLEEVTEEIRTNLAQQKAITNQQQKLDDLMAVLKRDYNVYFTQRIDAEAAEKDAPEPPAALVDFKKLAADNGLEYGETELLSFFEMQKLESPTLMYYFQQADQSRPLAVQVFRRDGMALFEPDTAYDTDRNFYLVMKIEEEKESEPSLDKLRDEVVAAWKHKQAAELALAKAEEMAKQATDSGRSLEDLFADRDGTEIEESDMFAWFEPVGTSATGMYALRLDDPGSPENVGPEFMEEVFGLGPNQAGAALDHGHDKAFVIRIAQRERSRSELRDSFLREWQVWPGIYSMQRSHVSEAAQAVLLNLIGGEAPDWKRTPDQSPMERDAAEGV
ncbi:periplasmic folding chaperone [Posidoniimonas polymericola]|uniref:Periplasmic folding chaperone n=1 Tax=Posidoniimonas polymericola TaxID=2528002 RepID=A0A5C5XYC1_9BACT|nr:hypothetical protein [Posidoniimonas polymericola]TWT67688.1 periplasmic folding chaperone [Posidoniimonas polymericola]